MAIAIHPFAKLRQSIRRSHRQFRHAGDTSKDVINPEMGKVFAYDIETVEKALTDYEAELAAAQQRQHCSQEAINTLLRESSNLIENHPDMDVRDFARAVAAHLIVSRGDYTTRRKEYSYEDALDNIIPGAGTAKIFGDLKLVK